MNKKEYDKQWAKEHCEERTEYKRQWRIKKYKFIDDYKLSKGCSVCGYNKCAVALDFHHDGDKEFGIAKAIADNYSLEKIKIEMEKCDILCSNCHRELHASKFKTIKVDKK